jgi:hypothetical protein
MNPKICFTFFKNITITNETKLACVSKIGCRASFQDTLSGANVAPISQVPLSAMMF